ncbi:lipopolysaccharide biosynthesis protein [Halomarina oriensis]|uniref:Oligosaccharide flippase family protein n=1 Tax=Halomarina oriensis TaxID=671145 RepID=A0A6B0GNI9_9EURY|nr:oligosaccharide flippase family protein [Halomarina oriensis]MWG33158.1 oligosaccharide flippase family protein [Halomarina oriensis]
MADLDRSSLALYGSRVGVSVIGFASTVYFARAIGAEGLGIYFTVETVVVVLAVLARFGVDSAVVKRLSGAADDAERARHLTGAFGLVLVPLAVVSLAVLLFADPLADLADLPLAPLALVGMVVALLVVETGQWLLLSALRGERRLATSAGVEFGGEVLRVGTSVWFVLGGSGPVGLVYGLLIGHAARALVAGVLLDTGLARPTRETMTSLVSFSKYTAGMNVSHLTYSWLDTLVLAVVVSKTAVGTYEAAWRVSLVVALASSAVGAALAPNVSAWAASDAFERIEEAFTNSLSFALLLVVPAVVGAAVLGGPFMAVAYGFGGGALLAVLVAGQVAQAVKDVVQSTLLGLDRPRTVFVTNAVGLGTNLVLTVGLALAYGPLGAAVGTALTAAVVAVVQWRALQSWLAARVDRRALAWQVGGALVMGGVVVGATRVVTPDSPVPLLALVALGALTYGGVVSLHAPTRTRLVGLVQPNATGQAEGS